MAGINDAKAQQKELQILTGHKVSNLETLLQSDDNKSSTTEDDGKSTMVFKTPKGEQVIDIDDDLLEVSEQEENKRLKSIRKQQKKHRKEVKSQEAQELSKERKNNKWSKRLLKPFSFTRKEG